MRFPIMLIFSLIIGFNHCMTAQVLNSNDSLTIFIKRKHDISLRGTHTLLTWSVINLSTGIYGSISNDGRSHYFHQMNAFWGGINLIISAAGYTSLRRSKNQPAFLHRVELDQIKTERVHKINMGLDALYMLGGAVLIELGKKDDLNRNRLEGYGYSIVLQGSFLLTFDTVMYFIHRTNKRRRLDPLLNNMSFTGNGFIYRFG